ncbi:MAG: Nitrous oxide reductase maturation protein, outer-membrane lipoprotein NosL [Rhodanobacteraceae bacterium]|jgi:copper chaperone NosL|nr:MAG: Nitrous oxide reductase maturation protein, outer-membrane lipoprotein NosL [Rhodanobacteraceae bacterium]
MRLRVQLISRFSRCFALLALVLLVAACSGKPAPARHAVDVQPDDVCAVCGMELSASPGPRGQAWVAGKARPLMFDSTRDFLAYVLQPENQSGLRELFVQDTARIDWQHPGRDAASFIDARRAVYVAWQPLPGSMGPTFAPFANRAAAEAFVRTHGGAVLAFDAITPELVATLAYHCPAAASAGDAHCMAPPASAQIASPPH